MVVWVACLLLARPEASTEWLTRGFLLAAALAPAVVLTLFASGIDDLTDLPRRYRQMGVHVGSQMGELRAPRDGRSRGILGPLIALARAAFGARDLLSPLTVATAALRPMLLLGALIAAMIALVEIPAAGVILLLVIV